MIPTVFLSKVTRLSSKPGGVDTVETTLLTYTLRNNLENLKFIGSGDFTGIGNDAGNRITGATGNDRLTGLNGADVFVFETGHGADSVEDFDVDQIGEMLDISALPDVTDFDDLQGNHLLFNDDGNAVITTSQGTIELIGVGEDVLTLDHFDFG